RGFVSRTPPHALARAPASTRAVRVGSLARSFASITPRGFAPRTPPPTLARAPASARAVRVTSLARSFAPITRASIDLRKQRDERFGETMNGVDEKRERHGPRHKRRSEESPSR